MRPSSCDSSSSVLATHIGARNARRHHETRRRRRSGAMTRHHYHCVVGHLHARRTALPTIDADADRPRHAHAAVVAARWASRRSSRASRRLVCRHRAGGDVDVAESVAAERWGAGATERNDRPAVSEAGARCVRPGCGPNSPTGSSTRRARRDRRRSANLSADPTRVGRVSPARNAAPSRRDRVGPRPRRRSCSRWRHSGGSERSSAGHGVHGRAQHLPR